MNIMDGFLTTHLERTFYKHESELIASTLALPTTSLIAPPQRSAPCRATRRRVPKMMDLANPVLLGPCRTRNTT